MSILIVDDNPVNLFVIEKILKNAGYEGYVSLSSAKQLFDYMENNEKQSNRSPVDLILLDIMMPEVDGIEACKTLQNDERFKDIPVIFITAIEDSSKLADALDAGGMDYVTKPINKVELLARIRVALRLKYEKDWHAEQEQKIQRELDLAMHVQKGLLNPPLEEDNIRINVSHLPSFKLAGDMYYWHKFSENKYGIILLDMMGHGISSSLVCMFISSVLRDIIKELTDPELVIQELNRYMVLLHNPNNEYDYYFTGVYLLVDTEKKTVEYVNAGHPEGYVLVDGKDLHTIERGCCAVGFFNQIEVKKSVIQYEENIQLLLYTDGVLEANGGEEVHMMKKLRYVASEKWSNVRSPIHLVLPEEQHTGQHDDMCLMMIQAK